MAIIVQVKHMSRLRRSRDLGDRAEKRLYRNKKTKTKQRERKLRLPVTVTSRADLPVPQGTKTLRDRHLWTETTSIFMPLKPFFFLQIHEYD